MTGSASEVRDVVLMFSGGKDSVAALMALSNRQAARSGEGRAFNVSALMCTFNERNDRVALHGTPIELVRSQAHSLDLPLVEVPLPTDCDNATYCARVGRAFQPMMARGVRHAACGDLYLEDIRRFRESQFAELGLVPMFPLWGRDTRALAFELIDQGLEAVICCVDEQVLDRSLLGRTWNRELVDELPDAVDPCGENGEFHTFVTGAPSMRDSIQVRGGALHVSHGRFCMLDLQPV